MHVQCFVGHVGTWRPPRSPRGDLLGPCVLSKQGLWAVSSQYLSLSSTLSLFMEQFCSKALRFLPLFLSGWPGVHATPCYAMHGCTAVHIPMSAVVIERFLFGL
jgi:hypothetical protein